MDFEQIRKLREERMNLHEQQKEMHERAKGDGRPFTAEEQQEWDRRDAEMERLRGTIEREERILEEENRLSQSTGTRAAHIVDNGPGQDMPSDDDPVEERNVDQVVDHAFRTWLMNGVDARGVPQRAFNLRAFLASAEARQMRREIREHRALSVGTDTAGGHTVPEGFRQVLETALLAFGGMRQARTTVLRTASGNDLPMPTSNDTSNVGAILAENTKASEDDVAFGQVILEAYKYTSNVVRVSLELLQDSAFDLPTWLGQRLGERIGRILNTHFTTGTGTNQPNGVVTAAAEGKVGTAGQVDSVIQLDLVDLLHSVDIAYRANAEWMLHDSTLRAIKAIEDADGRLLWVPGLAVREPDTILGHRYVVNNDMPEMAASARSILFGDFSKYMIRDVMDIDVIRLDEVYAEWAQVAFLAFSRHDADLLDAGTNPIKYYQNPAT